MSTHPYPDGGPTHQNAPEASLGAAQRRYDNLAPAVDPAECRHKWHQIGNARLCRWKCVWCGLVSVWDPE